MFPEHRDGLYLTHNGHRDYYKTIENYLSDNDIRNSWVSEEQKEKSLSTQQLWELQWYPDTPVLSHKIMGADLDAVLAKALEIEENERTG